MRGWPGKKVFLGHNGHRKKVTSCSLASGQDSRSAEANQSKTWPAAIGPSTPTADGSRCCSSSYGFTNLALERAAEFPVCGSVALAVGPRYLGACGNGPLIPRVNRPCDAGLIQVCSRCQLSQNTYLYTSRVIPAFHRFGRLMVPACRR